MIQERTFQVFETASLILSFFPKGYILLGDEQMLYRFNRHYDSIVKYMSVNLHDDETANSDQQTESSSSSSSSSSNTDGSYMKTVHMHMPNRQSRNYIDALLAFWPGLQVMKGDIKGAIKFHESLHHIVQKHDFLPEAVLFDHTIYWSNHLLRPEFLESTYYLYKATRDDYYLQIAKKMVNQLERYSRVECGYAAIQDLKTKQHEDRLDSFVYAETFKYLYLMFVEDQDPELKFDVDEFIFSTEAHLIPLDMNYYVDEQTARANLERMKQIGRRFADELESTGAARITWKEKTCPSLKHFFATEDVVESVRKVRESVSSMSKERCGPRAVVQSTSTDSVDIEVKYKSLPLRASEFVSGRLDHIHILSKMGNNLNFNAFLFIDLCLIC
jgi:hypothetical protein